MVNQYFYNNYVIAVEPHQELQGTSKLFLLTGVCVKQSMNIIILTAQF